MLSDEVESALIADLEELCRVRMIANCSAVSLVGRKIRTIIPRLAPALEVFEEERIHLMSQAANDLNLSFVVDKQQGPRLVSKLHASIIRKKGASTVFGNSWERLFAGDEPQARAADTWWMRKRDQLLHCPISTKALMCTTATASPRQPTAFCNSRISIAFCMR